MHSLYAVENAVTVRCHSCRGPIDLWIHHGLEISRGGVTTHPDAVQQLCLACLLRTFPSDEQRRLAPAYEHQLMLPREAGVPPWATTYVLQTEGKAGTWAEGYQAIGYAVQIRGWNSASADRQPHMTVIPDDPSDAPFSLVLFAGRVWLSAVTVAYLKFIWPFDLSLAEEFEVVNGRDRALRDADLSKLLRGRRFWQEAIHPSRPVGTGNYASGEEHLFLEQVESILARHERDGVRIINMQMLADKLGTVGRTQLFDMFKRVPEARVRFRQHKQRSQGR